MSKASPCFAPVGAILENGFDNGGARIYPLSTSMAIAPTAFYSNYIGSADALPVAPPVSALSSTAGGLGNSSVANAISSPFSKYSPLPWIIAGLFGAVLAMHAIHYK